MLLELLAASAVDTAPTLEFADEVVGPPNDVAIPVFPVPDVLVVFPEMVSAVPAPSLPLPQA